VGVRGDFLVIGSGIAGLRAAISLAETGDVVMLTKADPRESNTGYAQGGIAAAIGPDDSPRSLISRTPWRRATDSVWTRPSECSSPMAPAT
jgi:aspartate oxidase